MGYTEEILDDSEFQACILQAVRWLDVVAKVSSDNRAEIPFKRKGCGTKMIITIEEQDNDK